MILSTTVANQNASAHSVYSLKIEEFKQNEEKLTSKPHVDDTSLSLQNLLVGLFSLLILSIITIVKPSLLPKLLLISGF